MNLFAKTFWLALLLVAVLPVRLAAARSLPLEKIQLPPGFEIAIYADNVPGARSLTLGTNGTVYVGTLSTGKVYAVIDDDHDGKADQVITVAEGLNSPNGVAYRDGSLYVAEINRILRFDDVAAHPAGPHKPVVINDALPREAHHGWKFIAFGPDGWLYVPVGAPCNICAPDPQKYANIMRMKPDGTNLELFAAGVRNTVGFDWNPEDRTLWFTDNGRDMLGDDSPSCELNHAPKAGLHFGFPFCHEGTLPDPQFGDKRKCKEFVPPVVKLGPHVAPLGMRFYTGRMFPDSYANRIFIAEHGSWNRSKKIGYRVVAVDVDKGKPAKSTVFAEGWLQGEENWGRPVDVLVMPDGALLVSDDQAGVLYRISYRGP